MPVKKTIKIKRDKILCMFSGDLNSLGALYVLLKDPNFENKQIHVHQARVKDHKNPGLVEKLACEKILNYFKSNTYREFQVTECQHDISFLNQHQVEKSTYSGFMAANMVINDVSISAIAVGLNTEETKNVSIVKKLNKGRSLFQTMLPEELRYSTNYIFPVAHLSKLKIWQMLPSELKNLVWVCERPIYKDQRVYSCQQCGPCVDLDKVKKADAQSAWAHPLGLG